MRRVVVLGAGFGGLHAALALERALLGRRRVRLTLVNEHPHFLFTPLLPNVANGELRLPSITLSLRDQLDATTELVCDRITTIDLAQRVLRGQQRDIPFDYLLLAPGAEVRWPQGADAWHERALTCKDASDAARIREAAQRALAIASATEDDALRARMLTFVFAGGGPTGVELLAELQAALTRDPTLPEALREQLRFVLVEPGAELLPHLPPSLRASARAHFERQGVALRLGAHVTDLGPDDAIHLSDGTTLHAAHFFWCAGVRAPAWLRGVEGMPLSAQGRIRVNDFLQVEGFEDLYAIGDAAQTPSLVPQTAQVAKQQAPVAAHNLMAAMSGRTYQPWTFQHQGDLITLGLGHAAASIMGVSLEGAAAYGIYRMVYAGLMPGAMKKARILAEWLEHDLSRYRQRHDALPSP